MSELNLAELYEEVASTIKETSDKNVGKYLPWTYVREDVVTAIKFLCEQRNGSVETGIVRQFLVAILTKKIDDLPEGNSRMTVKIGNALVELTEMEYKTRLISQLEFSKKSTNNGPTISRLLGNVSCRDWMKKNHGIVYDGSWRVQVKE